MKSVLLVRSHRAETVLSLFGNQRFSVSCILIFHKPLIHKQLKTFYAKHWPRFKRHPTVSGFVWTVAEKIIDLNIQNWLLVLKEGFSVPICINHLCFKSSRIWRDSNPHTLLLYPLSYCAKAQVGVEPTTDRWGDKSQLTDSILGVPTLRGHTETHVRFGKATFIVGSSGIEPLEPKHLIYSQVRYHLRNTSPNNQNKKYQLTATFNRLPQQDSNLRLSH